MAATAITTSMVTKIAGTMAMGTDMAANITGTEVMDTADTTNLTVTTGLMPTDMALMLIIQDHTIHMYRLRST